MWGVSVILESMSAILVVLIAVYATNKQSMYV